MWSLYVTILILGLSSRVYTEDSCPNEEDIFPCKCVVHDVGNNFKDLKVKCEFRKETGDFETLRQAVSSLSGIKDVHLELRGYNISMPSKLFSGIDIKELTFFKCHMYSSTNGDQPWFLGLENTLKNLIIVNSVTVHEKLSIGHLNKLRYLNIRWNQIPELEDDFFSDGLSTLEILDIYKNDIKKIGNNVFSKLKNLRTLLLEDNQLGSIKRSMLPTPADRLLSLRLGNNTLVDLPEDIFTGMPSLKEVSLTRNAITTLDEGTWSPVWQQLTYVYLAVFIINMSLLCVTILIVGLSSRAYTEDSCPDEEDIFPCDCAVIYSGLIDDIENNVRELTVDCKFRKRTGDFETLRQGISSLSGTKDVYLRLRGYNISMPSKLFSGIDIKELMFDSCGLHSLANDYQPWFLGLENNLQNLIITSSVTVQEKLYIGQLNKLKYLNIRWNQIPELEDDFFSNGLSTLETLYIFGNNIKKIGSNIFSKLNNLKTLVLQDNQFGPIKRSMLPTTADRLNTLRLDNNTLTDLPEDIFTGMPSLEWLYLTNNGITTLNEGTWSPIWQQLSSVNLEGNKIICDERLNWIRKSKKRPTYISGQCSGPKEWEKKDLRDFFESRS